MINFTIGNLCTALLFTLLIHCGRATPVAEFYLSTKGNDKNPGTQDRPFATLQRAQAAVRQSGRDRPIEIILEEGSYFLSKPLILEPEDSGTAQAPITWRAADNARVVLSGGKPIEGTWLTDDGKTWHTDLPAAGQSGWVFRQLFVDGCRMTRARFPNKSESNPFLYATGGSRSAVRIEKALMKASWGNAANAQINIVPGWKFFNQWNTVRGVNMEAGEIHLADSELHADITPGNWFWIEGIKEELDEPGEWFLDEDIGRLYYIPGPGRDPNRQTIIAPVLNTIIHARGDAEKETHISHVYFQNLEFRHTTFSLGHIEPRVHTDAAVILENASHCRIENCHFENIGGYALWLHLDSRENLFDGNTVLESGGGGVLATGARFSYMDDSKLFTPGKNAARLFPILNRITRNRVKGCGRIRYYGGGVHLDSRPACMAMAPGNYIAHNHFEDLSRNGIFAFRNQGGNVVEYNHIHDAMQTTIDGACIHFATMNHLNAPNFILNNYLHDIWGYEQRPGGNPKRHLANGIFLDWATSNTTVKNNYIYNSGGEPIKNIMGNWNLIVEENVTSDQPIEPPFLGEVGPQGTATHEIDLAKNRLTGSVIHYSDSELVEYRGNWKPRTIDGSGNLFSFELLEAEPGDPAEIVYRLPIPEDGEYQVSILYLPGENNASNATIQIHHADGMTERSWDMRTGDKFGFALGIGKYRFTRSEKGEVRISNPNADGLVVADSVAFVKVE